VVSNFCRLVSLREIRTGGGEGDESEDRTMGALGRSPAAGRVVMREGECGIGATMPSDKVSIGEEPAEWEVARASWKDGPRVTMGGMPLAGRAAWMASQNASETTVRAGEAPWDWATAVSISTMVALTAAVGDVGEGSLYGRVLFLG
jgi:hypothetical protein